MAQNSASSNGSEPLDILIIGGSLGGLIAGILLKRKGHNVRILEQAASSEREGLAAGIGLQAHVKKFFETEDRLSHIPIGCQNDGFCVLDQNLEVKYKLGFGINLTSWDAAYYRARANFDGFASPYCPEPPPIDPRGTEGHGVYKTGKKVLKVENVKGRMCVEAEDTTKGVVEHFESDIVIAADGANSSIRRQLNPTLQREEPGYVIWRGTIPTADLSQNVLDKIENRPLIIPCRETYCVVYTIPGTNGSLEPGSRYINFVWYFWPAQTSLRDIMTDADGHYHRTTIPKGKIRDEIWQPQIEQARRLLPKELAELVEHIREPFVSVVASISSPKAAYFDNRLFLIGDALTQVQPNVGMGTNLAAFAAITLVDEVIRKPTDGPIDAANVAKWERKVLHETETVRLRSVAFASWYLNSWPKIAWYYAKYYAKYYLRN